MTRWLWRWGPALAYMAAIFVVSGIPNLGPLPANTSDKVAHFAAYGLLGVLLTRAFAGAARAGYTINAVLYGWVAATLYALTDELHQAFVPGRTPSVGDLVADAAGAALGAFVALVVAQRVQRIQRLQRTRGPRVKEREV